MAKKQYTLRDEAGRPWIVRPEDPAYALVSRLKYPEPVLPFWTLRTGDLEGHGLDVPQLIVRFSRATRAMPDDQDIANSLRRMVDLGACLDLLRPATIREPKE